MVVRILYETCSMQANDTLSHYHIIEQITVNGPGEVYLAEDTELERRVWLRVLPEEIRDDDERLKRLRSDVEAAAQLSHIHIARVYGIEEADHTLFITTEYIDGQPIADLIPEQGVSIETFLEWFIQILDGLAYAHEEDVCHGGIDTSTLMIAEDETPRIQDIGLVHLTQPEMNRDAVMYWSPERIDDGTISVAGDIFSTGIVMYEVLTGRRPFSGDSVSDMAASILRDEPPAVTDLYPDIPPHLDRIITTCLRKNPDERYRNAREVLVDLMEVVEIINRPAEVVDPGAAMGYAPAETTAPAPSESESTQAERTSPWLIATVVGAVVIVLGVFAGIC